MNDERINNIREYFRLLTAGDIDGVIAMFTDDGHIESPYLGTVSVRPFFENLDKATSNSVLTVYDVLIGEGGKSGAGLFRYDWTMADGRDLDFVGVDYFTFAESLKFQSMKIYYDTYPLRAEVGSKYANP